MNCRTFSKNACTRGKSHHWLFIICTHIDLLTAGPFFPRCCKYRYHTYTSDAPLCHIYLFVCLWIMDPHSRAPKKNTSYGNEVLPQDTTHLIQRPCYQRGSPCRDPTGNWTARRPPDHRKETQITAVVWPCFPFIGCGQNHLARHSERGKKKTRQTEGEVGRQHEDMGRLGSSSPSPRGQ